MTTPDDPQFEPQPDATAAAALLGEDALPLTAIAEPSPEGEATAPTASETNGAAGSDSLPSDHTPAQFAVQNGEIHQSSSVIDNRPSIAQSDSKALPPNTAAPVISNPTDEVSDLSDNLSDDPSDDPSEQLGSDVSLAASQLSPQELEASQLERRGDGAETAKTAAAVALLEPPSEEGAAPAKPRRGKRLQQAVQGKTRASVERLKQRRTQLFLLGAAATFVLGGATSYLLRRPTVGPSSLESALALVPNSAVASLSLNAQTAPWQQLRQLGTPTLQTGLGEWLAVGRDRVINLGYGDLTSIQQQLAGPPAMALIPKTSSSPAVPGQPPAPVPSDLLLVAPLKNPQLLARDLDQRQPPEGFENSTSSHRGIKIWDLQVDLLQRQSVAIFGNFGLLASDRTTIEQAIDSYQSGTALANLNEYEDAQRRLGNSKLTSEDGSLLSFYINGPAAVLSNQAAGRLLPLPATLQGLVSQVRLTDGDGLAIRSVTWDQASGNGLGVLGQAAPQLGDKSDAMVALGDRFPASTSFILSGSSLQEAWRSFSQGKPNATSLLSPEAIEQQVQAVTSMDLQQDWLSWMDGPYSMGILPIPTQANSRFQTGLTVMAQTSNRRLAERSLQKLDALMVNKYGLTLSTSQLDGENVVNWANAAGEAVVTHGWLEGNIAFLIVGAPGANLILPQPRATLAASRLYREGMPREEAQQDPAGVLFVDVDRVLDTQLPSLLPLTPASRPVLEQLKSVGVERRPLDERFSRYDLSLKFLPRSAAPPVKAPPVLPEQGSEPDVPQLDEASGEPATSPATPNTSVETLPKPETPEIPPEEADQTPVDRNPPEAQSQDLPLGPPIPLPGQVTGELSIGPVLPDSPPVFGPQPSDDAIPRGNGRSADDSGEAAFPSLYEEGAIAPAPNQPFPAEEFGSEDSPAEDVTAEDVVIDPRTVTAVPIGPPVPPKGFDFAPVGPKLPLPEAQQWSESFIQKTGESDN